MKTILIKQATIVDPKSSFHMQEMDILIEQGIISKIDKSIDAKGLQVLDAKGAFISNGWIDMQASLNDPGFEHKEDISSGLNAAANGGFAYICPSTHTEPPISSKSQIEYLINKSQNIDVTASILPIGTITQNRDGKEMAEFFDMMQAGAKAFSDYKKPIADAGLLRRVLLYAKNVNATLFVHCNDNSIGMDGLMHEGIVSTKLGLKGMPAMSEYIHVQRNITVLEETGGKMHISTISTKESVELIRAAKAKKLDLTCGVALANLVFNDDELNDFNTYYKVNPPLRNNEHISALQEGILDGTIDVIASDHAPQDVESKDLEFDHAAFGMATIETFYPMLLSSGMKLSPEGLVAKLYDAPSRILGLSISTIAEQQKARLTCFNPNMEWDYSGANKKTKGVNNPWMNRKIKGRAFVL
jgi:dihydroorotase